MTGNQEAEVCHKQADLSASTLINRHEFGIGRGLMVRAAASPTVTIKIDLVAVQQGAHEQEVEVATQSWTQLLKTIIANPLSPECAPCCNFNENFDSNGGAPPLLFRYVREDKVGELSIKGLATLHTPVQLTIKQAMSSGQWDV